MYDISVGIRTCTGEIVVPVRRILIWIDKVGVWKAEMEALIDEIAV